VAIIIWPFQESKRLLVEPFLSESTVRSSFRVKGRQGCRAISQASRVNDVSSIAMGTKGTIAHETEREREREEATGVGYHPYEEVFEDGNVYLQLEGFQFEASSIANILGEGGQPRLLVRLPSIWAVKLGLISEEIARKQAEEWREFDRPAAQQETPPSSNSLDDSWTQQ
jgi:hypothetical protein